MKKTPRLLLAGLIFGLIGVGTAHAQSSVTMYGILDAGLSYLKTSDGNRYTLQNGTIYGNRWGLRGSEDLGGGLRAIFQVESGFQIGTGKSSQGSRLFGRQSFVGLSSSRWGTVDAGRMYEPIVDLVHPLTADGSYGSVVFATPGDVDNNDFSSRVSNAIKYVSPIINGLKFEALVAPGGVAGSLGQGYTWSTAAVYSTGPFRIAAGYHDSVNANSTNGGLRTGWTSSTDDGQFEGGSINSAYETAHVLGIGQAAVQYDSGPWQIGVGYSNARYTADGESTFANTETYNTGRAYAFYRITPSATVGMGYIYTSAKGDASAHYNDVSAGAFYSVSKLTELYAVATFQRASGVQRTADGGLQEARADISSYGIDGTGTQTIVVVGMYHSF
ncbi:porin [Paraburkholderia sp. Ac-20347]|uniref:porin n=1 Tax=Paraburkholderia sp. Ac-20347 TaxID=2703892 RepID=UPI00197CD6A9|nr:porin [Paraburkholderia sp. Ac-20347]MBN3809032.1 porin [Paraburkholderia sp. Ac-20347]